MATLASDKPVLACGRIEQKSEIDGRILPRRMVDRKGL
jgi:hypothetical protein